MNNRRVGMLIIGISLLIGFIIYSFNRALTDIVNQECSHGAACPMWGTIHFQTNVSIGIMAAVLMFGIVLAVIGKEKSPTRQLSTEEAEKKKKELSSEEKALLDKVVEANGTIFQSDLVEKSGLTKVKVTRLLDRLEGLGLVERKRRGMTNVVILRH